MGTLIFSEESGSTVEQDLNSERPDEEAPNHEAMSHRDELETYARERGLSFVLPSPDDLQQLESFLQTHPLVASKNPWRRQKLEDIQALLAAEFEILDRWAREVKARNFQPKLAGLRYGALMGARLARILELAKTLTAASSGVSMAALPGHDPEDGEAASTSLQLELASLKRYLRYMLDQYHGGRLGVDFVARAAGFGTVERLLWKEDGSRRVIWDFGCGNGDLLIELARAARRRERGRDFLEEYLRLLKNTGAIDSLPSDMEIRLISDVFNLKMKKLNLNFRHLPEPLDPFLTGIDEAELTLEELKLTHGINAVKADICAQDFFERSGLSRGQAGVAVSILTLDRVADLHQFLQNFSESLEEGGRFLLANKGIIDARSDGEGPTIVYREDQSLLADSCTGTLEKLSSRLAEYGLKVETLALHPYAVISTEGIQHYDLVVVGGRKA